jgi:hypothetical protein
VTTAVEIVVAGRELLRIGLEEAAFKGPRFGRVLLFGSFLGKPCHWENVSFTRLKSDLTIFELSDVGLKSVELNVDEQHVDVGGAC